MVFSQGLATMRVITIESPFGIKSGQIIATSHDLTPNGGLVREIPLFQENPGW